MIRIIVGSGVDTAPGVYREAIVEVSKIEQRKKVPPFGSTTAC
jgi:hypothetical protein